MRVLPYTMHAKRSYTGQSVHSTWWSYLQFHCTASWQEEQCCCSLVTKLNNTTFWCSSHLRWNLYHKDPNVEMYRNLCTLYRNLLWTPLWANCKPKLHCARVWFRGRRSTCDVDSAAATSAPVTQRPLEGGKKQKRTHVNVRYAPHVAAGNLCSGSNVIGTLFGKLFWKSEAFFLKYLQE